MFQVIRQSLVPNCVRMGAPCKRGHSVGYPSKHHRSNGFRMGVGPIVKVQSA